jgi:hypothetical protein
MATHEQADLRSAARLASEAVRELRIDTLRTAGSLPVAA